MIEPDEYLRLLDEKRQRRHARVMPALAGSLAVGVVVDALLFESSRPGMNVPLAFVLATAISVFVLKRADELPVDRGRAFLLAAAGFFAVMVAVRDSALVTAVNLSVLALVILLAAAPRPPRVGSGTVADYIRGTLIAAFHAWLAGLFLIFDDIRWRRLASVGRDRTWAPWMRGALFAIPVVVIFGALFASADAAFGDLVDDAFSFDVSEPFEHVVMVLVGAWPVAGLLRLVIIGGVTEDEGSGTQLDAPAKGWTLGDVEAGVILGSVNALFAVFVAIQIRYLFGGHSLIQEQTGLTYAEYARRGFGELVVVALLTPGVAAGSRSLARSELGPVARLVPGAGRWSDCSADARPGICAATLPPLRSGVRYDRGAASCRNRARLGNGDDRVAGGGGDP